MQPCSDSQNHSKHLCKLTADGLHRRCPEDYKGLVENPQYVCKSCGRVAVQKDFLCTPVALGTWEE